MSADYTPTTAEIADWYAHKGDSTAAPYYASKLTKRVNEFDRWLAERDRQVAERAWDEGAQIGYGYGREDEKFSLARAVPTANPYRKDKTDE